MIIITYVSHYYCKIKSKDHSKYNLSIPALCIEKNEAKKYLNNSVLQSIVLARMIATKNPFDKVSKGLIIFLQIFFESVLVFSAILCATRFVQLCMYEKILMSYGKFSFFFFFLCIFFFDYFNFFYLFFILLIANILFILIWIDPFLFWRIFTTNADYYIFIYLAAIMVGSGFTLCLMNLITIILKISAKDNFEIFIVIIGLFFIVLISIMNIMKIVYNQKWHPNRIPISYFNTAYSVVMFLFFSIGSAILLMKFKMFSHLKKSENETKKKKKPRKYLRLGLSFCTLGGSALFSVVLWVLAANEISYRNTSVALTLLSFAVTGTLLASLSASMMFVPSKKKTKKKYRKFGTNESSSNQTTKIKKSTKK